MTSSKPAIRYQDVRHNVAKIKDYLARGGGLDHVLADQDMAYDAIRMCFLEISEASVKLGALDGIGLQVSGAELRRGGLK